jgi:hypothetical protein
MNILLRVKLSNEFVLCVSKNVNGRVKKRVVRNFRVYHETFNFKHRQSWKYGQRHRIQYNIDIRHNTNINTSIITIILKK